MEDFGTAKPAENIFGIYRHELVTPEPTAVFLDLIPKMVCQNFGPNLKSSATATQRYCLTRSKHCDSMTRLIFFKPGFQST
eukprot:2678608-Karenia_brevis.AAC.1